MLVKRTHKNKFQSLLSQKEENTKRRQHLKKYKPREMFIKRYTLLFILKGHSK